MKKVAGTNKLMIVAALVAIMGGSAVAGAPVKGKPAEQFKEAFPRVKMDGIEPAAVEGLFEILSGPNIYYYNPENDYLFVGDIYRKDGRNLTAARRGEIMAKKANNLPLEKSLKIGSGKKAVIEITDPDCHYCRVAEEFFSKRTDVTRYVFFAPLAHPEAINKIHYILGAENKAQAYDDMIKGKEIPKSAPTPTDKIKELAQEHLKWAREIGVRGTPTFFINGHAVVGADTKQLQELLKD